MPLYIKDEAVNELAKKLKQIANLPSKTEAVRLALKEKIENSTPAPATPDVVAITREFQDRIAALGSKDANFDMKKFSDWICGEEDDDVDYSEYEKD